MSEEQISKMGNLTSEGGSAVLRFERQLPNSSEEVWRAITDPDEIVEWYVTKAIIDGKKDGSIEFWSGPNQIHITGKILAWEPPHVFEHEWKVSPRPEFPSGENSIVRWEITPQENGCTLKMTHRNITRRVNLGALAGLHTSLDRLEAYLSGGPLPDFYERFRELQVVYARKNAGQRNQN